jgi:hypothetical protein
MPFLRTVCNRNSPGCSPSLLAAAKALNERGLKTATDKAWTAVQVIRVRERLADRQ